MKKIFVMVLALFFAAATSNLVLAQAGGGTPGKTGKSHKRKHHKKAPKVETTNSTGAPAGNTTAPAK